MLSTNRTKGLAGAVLTVALGLVVTMLSLPALGRITLYTPPSTPGDFHVTGITTQSVSFAWAASKAGTDAKFNYVIVMEDGISLNVGQLTSYKWTVGVQGGGTYSFYIYAIDSNNKASAASPAVTVTLPSPPPPPPIIPVPPVVTSVSTTPTTITLSWTEATPSSEISGYAVVLDGTNAYNFGVNMDSETEWTILNLSPGTTYSSIVVVAFSSTDNTADSEPTNATTTVSSNNIPPTVPSDLTGYNDGGGEAVVSWNPSSSPYEPASDIEYKVYVAGTLEIDSDTVGATSTYAFPVGGGGPEQIYVVAVDQYGNQSEPSNVITIDF